MSEEIAKLGLARRVRALEKENSQLKDDASHLEEQFTDNANCLGDEVQKQKINEKLTKSNVEERWLSGRQPYGWGHLKPEGEDPQLLL